ncbi:MAG: ATP synthase subunit I [Anaerovoracaceae bacterium]
MNDLKLFKAEIIKYATIVGIVIGLASVLFLGMNLKFLIGLSAGTVISIVNFGIITFTGRKVSENKEKAPAIFGYFIRMPIYAVAFFLSVRYALICGVGCAIGFITIQLGIIYMYGIKSRFPGARKNPLNESDEPREWRDPKEWEDEEDSWHTDKKSKGG